MVENRILIVQENFRERIEMTEGLEGRGFRVDSVQNGTEAEALVSRQRFVLVVADLDTPEFSALDFLQHLKDVDPTMELIILSDRPLVEEAVTLMRNGALDFIVKPLVMEQLILTARHQLDKQSRMAKEKAQRDASSASTAASVPTGVDQKAPVEIISEDRSMQRLLTLGKRVADSTAAVLIQGESGTGKELFARFIHENSRRVDKPFVALNCAALPENLLESELFGHEKGAFTGAVAKKEGKFELAHQGTLFLDEITEMQYHLQAKLLRVLQEKVVDRLGGTVPVAVDVRIVASTNRDVKQSIEKGEFREDLYFRLNTIPLHIPPLRERGKDLEILCNYFIQKYREIDGRDVKGMTPETFHLLKKQKFSGNVRELENIIHRAVLLAQGETIVPEDLMMEDFYPEEALTSQIAPENGEAAQNAAISSHSGGGGTEGYMQAPSTPAVMGASASYPGDPAQTGDSADISGNGTDTAPSSADSPVVSEGDSRANDLSESPSPFDMIPSSLKEMEEKMIFHTLDKTQGNRTHAAKILGISVRTLRNKLNEYKEKQK